MHFDEIVSTPRWGGVIENSTACLGDLMELAKSTEHPSDIDWRAGSIEQAAAWLLCMTHSNCVVEGDLQRNGLAPHPRNLLLSFRGQAAKYSGLVASAWRGSVEQRRIASKALDWLHGALQVWVNENFIWHEERFRVTLDSLDVIAVGQHYGLPTHLIDWTWDPLNALAFSLAGLSEGEEGVVLLRSIGKLSQGQTILPPTFSTRQWRQAGLFQHQSCPPEQLSSVGDIGLHEMVSDRNDLGNYPRITFRASAVALKWAKERLQYLLPASQDPLSELVNWAKTAACQSLSSTIDLRLTDTRAQLELVIKSFGLGMPSPIEAKQTIEEDTGLILNVMDNMALRLRGGRRVYDGGSLINFCEGLGDQCSVSRAAKPTEDTVKGRVFLRVANRGWAHLQRQRIFYAHFGSSNDACEALPWFQDPCSASEFFLEGE